MGAGAASSGAGLRSLLRLLTVRVSIVTIPARTRFIQRPLSNGRPLCFRSASSGDKLTTDDTDITDFPGSRLLPLSTTEEWGEGRGGAEERGQLERSRTMRLLSLAHSSIERRSGRAARGSAAMPPPRRAHFRGGRITLRSLVNSHGTRSADVPGVIDGAGRQRVRTIADLAGVPREDRRGRRAA